MVKCRNARKNTHPPLWQAASVQSSPWTFNVCEILECKIHDKWLVQAYRHGVQCSVASVGLAQAHPNKLQIIILASTVCEMLLASFPCAGYL